MTIVSLLAHLQSQGIKLWLQDGQLRYRAPDGAMTPDRRAHQAVTDIAPGTMVRFIL